MHHIGLREPHEGRAVKALAWRGIGEPARKHGVVDGDIWHAVRNAMRRVLLDDDLVMLISPASDGALLEIGILDIEA